MIKLAKRRLQRQSVTLRAEAAYNALSNIGKIRMVAEGLSSMHIGQVHLDKRYFDTEQRIAQRHTGVCKGARIKNNERDMFFFGIVNSLNKLEFGIALQRRQAVPGRGCILD